MLLLRSVAHTRPSQLWHRARLTVRRRALVTLPGVVGRRAAKRLALPCPPLASNWPLPPFAPRTDLATDGPDGATVRFGGTTALLRSPVDWPAVEARLSTALDRLAVHYQEYLEGVEDRRFLALALDWVDAHPPYRPRYWLEDWNAYAASIRVVVYLQEIARRGFERDRPEVLRIADACARHLRFVERNLELDIRGNHLVKNVRALLWGARCFDGPESLRWRDLGLHVLQHELAEQVLADGVHFERSPAYHGQVFADLLECRAALGERSPASLREALDRMAQATVDLTHPDGLPSLFNDGGLHMARAPQECSAVHAGLGGRPGLVRTVAAFPDAGFFAARAAGDYALCDCGPLGPDHLPAHAHGDALAFEWSVGGQRVVVDTGVFEYEPGPKRAWSRSTCAHNTVSVGDSDQAEFWSSFRVGRRPTVRLTRFQASPDGFELEGAHDGFRVLPGSPVHRRSWRVGPRRIEVRDTVDGGAGQEVVARILLAPGLALQPGDAGIHTVVGGPGTIRLITTAQVSCREAPWWPDFGVHRSAAQIEIRYGVAPCAGEFVLEADPG